MAKLAFYKAKGTWVDQLIRLVTRSPYSHVELITEPDLYFADGSMRCTSSSLRDGGVRVRNIILKPGHWDIVEVEWYAGDLPYFFKQFIGAKYDFAGLIFSQFFNWRRQDNQRWFCSELIAASLGIPNPSSYSPGELKAFVEKLNQVHRQGKCEGARIG